MNTLARWEELAVFDGQLQPALSQPPDETAVASLTYAMMERDEVIRNRFAGIFNMVGHIISQDNQTMYTPPISLPATGRNQTRLTAELYTPTSVPGSLAMYSLVNLEVSNHGRPFLRDQYTSANFLRPAPGPEAYNAQQRMPLQADIYRPPQQPGRVQFQRMEAMIAKAEDWLEVIEPAARTATW